LLEKSNGCGTLYILTAVCILTAEPSRTTVARKSNTASENEQSIRKQAENQKALY
jgi:hypothetical protein